MKMKKTNLIFSVLQVKDYFVDSFEFKILNVTTKKNPKEIPPIPVIDFNIKKNDITNLFYVNLRLEIKDYHQKLSLPFQISISLLGVFQFMEEMPKEKTDELLLYNAIPVLYTSARTIIHDFTLKTPIRGYILPTVNFIEYFKAQGNAPEVPKKK